jgi:hypothetical protein
VDKISLMRPTGDLSRLAGIRPNQLAKQLGCAPGVVHATVASGELTVWRLGKTGREIVVPLDAAEAWLKSR